MNSEFVVSIRKLTHNLPPTWNDIERLDELKHQLEKEVEKIILKNERIGKQHLQHNLNELLAEKAYVDSKVQAYLRELSGRGLDEYNADYSNSKDLAMFLWDAIDSLRKLKQIYFPNEQLHMPNNHISIDGDNNLVIQDVHGSHIYVNSDEGLKKLLKEQSDKLNEVLQLLQSQNEPQLQQFSQQVQQITQVLDLIDSDMDAAFNALDKVNWGSRKGTYNDLKGEWIEPPIGFSKSQFRSRLKIFVKSYWKQ